MAVEFEFLSPSDRPALVACATDPLPAIVAATLTEMGYKVHTVTTHEDFQSRFAQVQYQVVVLEDVFGGGTVAENTTLKRMQELQMNLRRHATFLLFGNNFTTMNPLQGFQQSVHAVVNPSDLDTFSQIVQKAVAENELFLNAYRDTQARIAQGKV
jgi:hypothetical protein